MNAMFSLILQPSKLKHILKIYRMIKSLVCFSALHYFPVSLTGDKQEYPANSWSSLETINSNYKVIKISIKSIGLSFWPSFRSG